MNQNGVLEPQYLRNDMEATLAKSTCQLMGLTFLEEFVNVPDNFIFWHYDSIDNSIITRVNNLVQERGF
jgi:hypothetical protein